MNGRNMITTDISLTSKIDFFTPKKLIVSGVENGNTNVVKPRVIKAIFVIYKILKTSPKIIINGILKTKNKKIFLYFR